MVMVGVWQNTRLFSCVFLLFLSVAYDFMQTHGLYGLGCDFFALFLFYALLRLPALGASFFFVFGLLVDLIEQTYLGTHAFLFLLFFCLMRLVLSRQYVAVSRSLLFLLFLSFLFVQELFLHAGQGSSLGQWFDMRFVGCMLTLGMGLCLLGLYDCSTLKK
jgi:cell shape-determining protein MreD